MENVAPGLIEKLSPANPLIFFSNELKTHYFYSREMASADPEPVGDMVWISATGSKYHRIPNCGNMNPDNATEMTRAQAEAAGYGACKKCY